MVEVNDPAVLVITRIYKAPVEVVWAAWTDPEQVAKWWGPRGFSLTTHSKELSNGGHWAYTMHGPDGVDYPNRTHYLVVEPLKKLVYDHGGNEQRPPLFRVSVEFASLGDQTEMRMEMRLPTAEAAAETQVMIKKAGGESTWDRLAEHLSSIVSGQEVFVLTRSFDAPPELVFSMWTDPSQLARWLPPRGLTMEFLQADIRTGGGTFFRMTNGRDVEFYVRTQYHQVEYPSSISYSQQFCDADGSVSRHPLAADWPESMLTTVTFHPEGSNRTRVSVRSETLGAVSERELSVFVAERSGMTVGWSASFDALEVALLEAR